MPEKQQLHILYFTEAGEKLAARVAGRPEALESAKIVTRTCGRGCLQAWTKENFCKGNVLLYIGACGIAVRAISPHLQGKAEDPAVIVMDEKGENVIPLLSGHLGGANRWAKKLAAITGGKAILTTATDVNGMFAVDVFAKDNDLEISDLKRAGRFTAQLLRDKEAHVVIPQKYSALITPRGKAPSELKVEDGQREQAGENRVLISPDAEGTQFQLIPRCVVIGMGCRRGKSGEDLKAFAEETLRKLGLSKKAVCVLASIDVKKDEAGLLALAQDLGVPFQTFSSEKLEETGLNGWKFAQSERVRAHVGTGNVCERAAVAAGAERILLGKTAGDGMTICVGIRAVELLWQPQIGENTGTEEVDRQGPEAERDNLENAPKGHLFVVGIGPGNPEGMTGQAAKALEKSDTIIGYSVYNELVKPYYPEKRYLTTPMTGEEARCKMALEEAAAGHIVSLICSGDPGVYGMAGLVLELSERSKEMPGRAKEPAQSAKEPTQSSKEPAQSANEPAQISNEPMHSGHAETPEVGIEIVSGVTAALSGAALLGAPLVHDFAVISLSDRLTPWERIEKRLRSSAEADLCIVLYNPSSRGRREHLHRAAQILMEKVPGSRICGIADRIGREGEKTRVMTLKELESAETDMFSTVFVGNSSTRRLGDKMVTPRGYKSEE